MCLWWNVGVLCNLLWKSYFYIYVLSAEEIQITRLNIMKILKTLTTYVLLEAHCSTHVVFIEGCDIYKV